MADLINKITSPVTPDGLVRKTNEIIDTINSGGTSSSTWGISPNPVTNRRKVVDTDNNTVTLYWKTGSDAQFGGCGLSVWAKDVIVKKEGSLPQSIDDGIIVVESTIRDQYYRTGYVDNQENGNSWFYRAFPVSAGGVASTSRLNDFQYFFFGVVIDEINPDIENRVEALPFTDAYFYDKPKMDFVAQKFCYGGWEKYEDIPFAPRPCMLSYNGTVDYYLDINDYTKKVTGEASDYGNDAYNGNAMAEFPLIFRYVYTSGKKRYVYLCSEQVTNLYTAYPFLRKDGTYNDHFYYGLDESNIISGKMRCIGKGNIPTQSQTAQNEFNYAAANNPSTVTPGKGWFTQTIAQYELILSILEVFFCSHDSENYIGIQGSSSSALLYGTGSLKDKGPFYGTKGSSNLKLFGIEGLFGHRWVRLAGLMSVNYNQLVKQTWHTGDGSTVEGFNITGSGYKDLGVMVPAGMLQSYIKEVWGNNELCYAPKVVGGSATTYYGDAGWSATGTTMLIVGSNVFDGSMRGPFAWAVAAAPSVADWGLGASLSYTPHQGDE